MEQTARDEVQVRRHHAGAKRSVALIQTIGIGLACSFVALLHAGNDGLWYRGDAARHALNGLFWWDLVSTWPSDPSDYTLRYYARYPALALVYPPAFHLLEGGAFRLLGASPLVAKGLVTLFALIGCVYVGAWLRRYVSETAGWGGVLLALQPGIIIWSNAVMLNVPAMTLAIIALYYARAWIDTPSLRRFMAAWVSAG